MPKKSISINKRQFTLDARPDRLDLRDLPFRPPVESLEPVFPGQKEVARLLPGYMAAGLVLDQGNEGACTGFGLAAVINYLLWVRSGLKMEAAGKVSPRMLYHLARFYDEWPGEDYEGSSCRGALKGWHRHGVCAESFWPYRAAGGEVAFVRPSDGWDRDALSRPLGVYYRIDKNSVVDMQAAIYQIGAVYVSANVHDRWEVKTLAGEISHRRLPIIKPGGQPSGGHAFALVGYNERGFVLQNSWGPDWGAAGFAVLTYEDWVANGTDAWVVALGAPTTPRAGKTTGRLYFVREGSRSLAAGAGVPERQGAVAGMWSEQEAYWHTLVTGNDGCLINRLPQVADEKVRPRSWDWPVFSMAIGPRTNSGMPRLAPRYANGRSFFGVARRPGGSRPPAGLIRTTGWRPAISWFWPTARSVSDLVGSRVRTAASTTASR